jgi:SSS family transporter
MSSIDIFIIGLYCLGLLAIGFAFSRKATQSASQMFVAGRQSPWWISGLSAYMTMFSAGTFVVWGGIAYEYGFVAISISIGYAVAAFIVGYFLAGRWRRLGVSTAAEFIELRFGKKPFLFYTWFKILFSFTTGLALYALARVICPLIILPASWFIVDPETVAAGAEMGQLSVFWACVLLGSIVVAYTMIGGLWAVLLTDTLQFFVLALTVVVAVVLGLSHIGGFSTFIANAPDGFFHITGGDFTMLFLFGWMLVNAFSLGAEWQFLQRYFCVSRPRDAQKALYLFGVLYLVSPFFFMAPAMFYRTITGDADPEEAFILMCREVLPAGMIGMMVAALFSATASMISSVLNVYASVLTDDVYKKSLRPGASERETVIAGRLITIMIGLYMIAGAIVIPMLTSIRDYIIVFGSLIGPALLLPTIWGLFSKRITEGAVWWCVIANASISLLTRFGLRSEGWFGDLGILEPLIQLIESNMRVTDLLVGVLTTTIVLLLMEWQAREESAGWRRMTTAAAANLANEGPSIIDSRGPATVMVWSLGFLSAVMLAITILSNDQHTTLIVATTLLFLMTMGFIPLLKKSKPLVISADEKKSEIQL